jgi:deoxyribodipyrimidine photolyase-related protein
LTVLKLPYHRTMASDLRNLVLVLGDQLSDRTAAFDGFDAKRDALWLAETQEEATHVWSHKLRLVQFFSAMRHFRDIQRQAGRAVHYHELSVDPKLDRGTNFAELLKQDVAKLRPEKLIVLEPGDFRVWQMLEDAGEALTRPLNIRTDRSFYCSIDAFRGYAEARKSLLLENFYRWMRKDHSILVDDHNQPEGGQWNFDQANREAFGKQGPSRIKPPRRFKPDALTQRVADMVQQRFADHPGWLDYLDMPVTRDQAKALLKDFIDHRLPSFGPYQDAMWDDLAYGYHSRLSAAINLHLLEPREAVDAAIEAYRTGQAPLQSVEGFVRQILGWREFVRGIYWYHMPQYAQLNALQCEDRDVPSFFWDGQTHMHCIEQSMQHVLNHGYAHHIHRLMILGLFAMLAGVHPKRFNDWHLAMYLDAIDWVSLPNALGMSQFGDGGIVGTKPYCATGKYIQRMSNFCQHCRYDPAKATGEDACPFTTLYWDFLARHRTRLKNNQRLAFQLKNVDRKESAALRNIRQQAEIIKRKLSAGEPI